MLHVTRPRITGSSCVPVYARCWRIGFGSGFLADGSEVVVREIGAHRHVRIYSGLLPIVFGLTVALPWKIFSWLGDFL
jgi:hypothetical protein